MSALVRPRGIATRLVVLGGLAYLAVRSFVFLAQPGYPAGYFYDLGAHAIATGYQAATLRTFSDLLDCVGWAAWVDLPQFVYNPMTTSAVLVSIAKLTSNVQLSLKITMVAQFWLALISMATLYRTTRRSWAWALLAGLLYALFPATALQISSDLDLGFVASLAPLALALGLRLARRFGQVGLPLAGAICGYAAQAFATEYFVVVSLPLFAAVALYAYPPRGRFAWIAASFGGALAAFGVGLYCIIPTFASTAVVTAPAARITDIETGNPFVLFAESLGALWHGVLSESTLNTLPEFNVSSHLWVTSVALTILWWAAIAFAVRRSRRDRVVRRWSILVALLLLLAFGSTVPFAASFWAIVSHVPFLQLLRTPDRLVVVPFIFLVWWGVAMLQSAARAHLGTARGLRGRLAAPSALLALFSFAYFDFVAGSLIVRPDLDYRLPGLAKTNASAERQPPPIATYTFVNEGSILDTPLYGLGVPTRAIAQDLLSRFGSRPAHALGALQKAGIRTIVTTPVWTVDGGSLPDVGEGYATNRAVRIVHGSARAAAVWRVRDAVPEISQPETACLLGGPGTFDQISLLPELSKVAIVSGGVPCAFDVYADPDPRDEFATHAIAWWTGAELSSGQPARDHDYTFITTRALLARPWYRNAVDGDTPVFGKTAVAIDARWRADVAANVPASGRYVANIRAATSVDRCFLASVDRRRPVMRCLSAGYGLHWVSVPLAIRAGPHEIQFSIARAAQPVGNSVLDGIALEPAGLVPRGPSVAHHGIIVYSARWAEIGISMRPLWLAAGHYQVAFYASDGKRIDKPISFDRRRARRHITAARTGFHRIAKWPQGAETVEFSADGTPWKPSVEPIARKRSATTWDVTVRSGGVVRATVLNDGWWFLDSNRHRFEGFDCDLVDTCFGSVPPGRYTLHHRWPPAIVIGLLATALTWVVAAAPCALTLLGRQARRRRARTT